MKVILAKTAGFCFGVERAVKLAFNEGGKPGTYTFGPIIHNDDVVQQLKNMGIESTDAITQDDMKTLIIRSHGVAPDVYEEANHKAVQIVDATCPYVKKIHKLVERYHQKGDAIILVGNSVHPEIQGINGWAKNQCIIVKDVHELETLTMPKDKHYLVVSQTTYKKQVVDEVITYLEENEYYFKYMNTICNATRERQDEAVIIAKQVACMVVVGSQYSSNTQKLFELCQKYCSRTYCVSNVSELTKDLFEGVDQVGVTAGASTPDAVIAEVVRFIEN
ncbi:MAG: 4-hydroxy-3-methylbut-2-enyl diphosphate reductase [Cellulosilyticaceae bacterium]